MQLEEKLALIQKMRQNEQRNYERMGVCNDSYRYTKGDLQADIWPGEQISLFSSSFRLRFLLALFLFLAFFYLDIRQISLGKLDSEWIQHYIGETVSLPLSSLTINQVD
ncbi:MAG: hypothetical protein IJP31_00945 [Lachnospiraceae bacterium]|nr:hypothetical protein [Lachnospiraceae bacterium]